MLALTVALLPDSPHSMGKIYKFLLSRQLKTPFSLNAGELPFQSEPDPAVCLPCISNFQHLEHLRGLL